MVEDNAVEPPLAPFPAIPAEFPGIELECHNPDNIPEVAPLPAILEEEDARCALANANLGTNIIPNDTTEDDRSGLQLSLPQQSQLPQPQQSQLPQPKQSQPHQTFEIRFKLSNVHIQLHGVEMPDLANADDSLDETRFNDEMGSGSGKIEDDKDYEPSKQEDIRLEDYRSALEHRSDGTRAEPEEGVSKKACAT